MSKPILWISADSYPGGVIKYYKCVLVYAHVQVVVFVWNWVISACDMLHSRGLLCDAHDARRLDASRVLWGLAGHRAETVYERGRGGDQTPS